MTGGRGGGGTSRLFVLTAEAIDQSAPLLPAGNEDG